MSSKSKIIKLFCGFQKSKHEIGNLRDHFKKNKVKRKKGFASLILAMTRLCYRVYFYQQYQEPDPALLPPVFPWTESSGSSSCTLLWYRICIYRTFSTSSLGSLSHKRWLMGFRRSCSFLSKRHNRNFSGLFRLPRFCAEKLRLSENVGDSKTESTLSNEYNFVIEYIWNPSICSMIYIQLWLVYGYYRLW